MAWFALLRAACVCILFLFLAPGALGLGCNDALAAPQCSDSRKNSSEALRAACAETPYSSVCAVLDGCGAQGESPVCDALGLLASLCGEFPGAEGCSRLVSACGEVPTIIECTAVSTLVSTDDAYEAVREICDDHFMDACEMCKPLNGDPTTVGLKEAQALCASPLGTLSELCLAMDMAPCSDWKLWCQDAKEKNYTYMCSRDFLNRNTVMPGGHQASMDSSMPHDGSSDHSTIVMNAPENAHAGHTSNREESHCYMDPENATCVDFQQSDTDTLQDLMQMCRSKSGGMPWMIGCSLWSDCKDMGSQEGYCHPFTLLATLCTDMPMMTACNNYNSLCGTNSVIKQCKEHPPVPNALTTNAAQTSVFDSCMDHSMPACIQCPRRGAGCPEPMRTTSALCFQMPDMEMCRGFHHFCSTTRNYFRSLCIPKKNDYLPPMRMYFHSGTFEVILFEDWVTRSNGEFAVSFVAIVVIAIIAQALKVYRSVLENRWHAAIPQRGAKHPKGSHSPAVGSEDGTGNGLLRKGHQYHQYIRLDQARRNLTRSLFTALTATLDYGLMLVAMIFNVYLFFAVIIGFAIGSLLWGHIGEPPVDSDTNGQCACCEDTVGADGHGASGFLVLNDSCCGGKV